MTTFTASFPERAAHSVDDALGCTPVDHPDDLLDGPTPFRSELVRMLERALDPVDDLLETLARGRRRRTRRAPRSACRRRSSPPTTRPAGPPRRRGRRRPAGRPRAHPAGSCRRCTRRRPHAGAVSRARRGRYSSPPARRPRRAPLPPEALAPLTVTRVRPEEELYAPSRAARPPLEEALDERALVRCVARRVPRDQHERAARVEPVPAQELLVVGARSPTVEEIGLRPPGDADAVRLDPVVAAQVVLHDAVLDDVEVAVGRDDALADRVVPARDVRDDREPQATRSGEERHRARGLDVREDEAGAVPPHRLEQPSRDMPPRAEEPPLHRIARSPASAEAGRRGRCRASSSGGRAASARHGSRAGGSAASRAGGSRAGGRARRRSAPGLGREARAER